MIATLSALINNRIKYRWPILALVFFFLSDLNSYAQDNRPNILWIVSEDNNVSMLGCYGNTLATTPNIDRFAKEGVRFTNAFATAPVCAPSRCTLITGMYPPSLGTEHMRSNYAIPASIKFFPRYLREAGYYTTNNSKKDYNTVDQTETWDESSTTATYKNRKPGQPFFAVFNLFVSHESSIHKRKDSLRHDPYKIELPPYHPDTKEMRADWAQYYDNVETMDQEVARLLKELDEAGLSQNTIVFYYADNGGVLPRSKRFMYESGLHVPLIIRIPPKFRALSPFKAVEVTDRLVSFTDFAPTVLALAGLKPPDTMQGLKFLGHSSLTEHRYTYAFRGRMDERIDLSRSVRDKKYRYIRNYLPHLIYGQHLQYLWQASSMQSWEQEYRAGHLNELQLAFWKEKPSEELFNVDADPHNVHNLAADPAYDSVLQRFRKVNHEWTVRSRDIGFVPEAILYRLSRNGPLKDLAPNQRQLERIIETAEMASFRDTGKGQELLNRLRDNDPSVRYWAAVGCTVLRNMIPSVTTKLKPLLQDSEGAVQVAAAEALYYNGEREAGFSGLVKALKHENPFVRVQTLNVLQSIGKDASPALENVRKLIPIQPAAERGIDNDFDVRAARTFVETINR